MKILQVASFIGNIGDNASHMGFNNILNDLFDNYEITRMEIRQFYNNYKRGDKKYFNEKFISQANAFDLLVIGGGGFLDYWVKNSATGTTLDIDHGLLKKLSVPTLITSIGCHPHREVPEGNVQKFTRFLDEILCRSNIKIALRNDGSVNSFKNEIGEQYLEQIEEVLDSGFFYQPPDLNDLPARHDYVAVNIAGDQIKMHCALRGKGGASGYFDKLSRVLAFIITDKKLDIVLIPHIYSDLVAISELLNRMDDYLIRKHITIAPCVQYDAGANYLFSIYNNSSLVIGMRYHANVCSLAMGKAAIGLAALDRVKYLYDSFLLDDRYVQLAEDTVEELMRKISSSLTEKKALEKKCIDCVRVSKEDTMRTYAKMFSDIGLGVS